MNEMQRSSARRGEAKTLSVGIALMILLLACATPYQPEGIRGGYSDTKLTGNRSLVSFRGNEHLGREMVQTYLLYRCAEVTTQNGFAYFLIVEGGVESSTTTVQTAGQFSSTTTYQNRGGVAYGSTQSTYTPGQSIPVTRYLGTVTIQMYGETMKPDDPNVYDARELLTNLAPRIER